MTAGTNIRRRPPRSSFLARRHCDEAMLGTWIVKMIIAQIADKPCARVLVHQRPANAHVRRFWMGWKKIVERAASQDSGKLIANVRPATRHRVVDQDGSIAADDEETRVVVVHEPRALPDHRHALIQKMPGLISLGKDVTSSAAPRIVIADPTTSFMSGLYTMERSLISLSAFSRFHCRPETGSSHKVIRSWLVPDWGLSHARVTRSKTAYSAVPLC
jgi:hypothetical protein